MMENSEMAGKGNLRTIPLSEIKDMLGYNGQGYRSVLKWCRDKGVVVLGIGLNRRVLALDWWRVNRQEFIRGLMALHPKNWREKLHERGLDFTEADEKHFAKRYQPKSKEAQSFRNKFK